MSAVSAAALCLTDDDLPDFVTVQPNSNDEQLLGSLKDLLSNDSDQHFSNLLDGLDDGSRSEEVRSIIQDANQDKDRLGRYLWEAYTKLCMPVMEDLLQLGAAIHTCTLQLAVERHDTLTLNLFLEHGWNINQALNDQEPPALSLALQDIELTRWLLSHAADPDARCRLLNLTPLSKAVHKSPMPVVELLLKGNRHPDIGELLHHAVYRSRYYQDYMQLLVDLIKRGAHVNRVMFEDDRTAYNYQQLLGLGTALHEAAMLGKMDIIELLVENGADLTIRNSRGELPEEAADRCAQHEASLHLKLLRRAKVS